MSWDLRKSDLPVARMRQETPWHAEINASSWLTQHPAVSSKQNAAQACSLDFTCWKPEISCCSSFACWRFEPESNMSSLSALGRITPWLLFWWPCRLLVCMCAPVCEPLRRFCMHSFTGDTCVPERLSSPAGANWLTGERTTRAAAFCLLDRLRSAQLCSVKPQIIHSLG